MRYRVASTRRMTYDDFFGVGGYAHPSNKWRLQREDYAWVPVGPEYGNREFDQVLELEPGFYRLSVGEGSRQIDLEFVIRDDGSVEADEHVIVEPLGREE